MINENETSNNSIYLYGSKCINLIAIIPGLINFIDSCIIIDFNEIILSDHRGYLIDLGLEEYFKVK